MLWTVNADGSWHQLPIADTAPLNTQIVPSSAPAHQVVLPVRPRLTRSSTREGTFSSLALLMSTPKSSSEPGSIEHSRSASIQALDAFGSSESILDGNT